VAEKVKGLPAGEGLDAATGEYKDLIKAGIIDPAKVTRSGLQNAASIAACSLTTEAVVADKPEKASAPAGGGLPGVGHGLLSPGSACCFRSRGRDGGPLRRAARGEWRGRPPSDRIHLRQTCPSGPGKRGLAASGSRIVTGVPTTRRRRAPP
jgi:hypothetical protein